MAAATARLLHTRPGRSLRAQHRYQPPWTAWSLGAAAAAAPGAITAAPGRATARMRVGRVGAGSYRSSTRRAAAPIRAAMGRRGTPWPGQPGPGAQQKTRHGLTFIHDRRLSIHSQCGELLWCMETTVAGCGLACRCGCGAWGAIYRELRLHQFLALWRVWLAGFVYALALGPPATT